MLGYAPQLAKPFVPKFILTPNGLFDRDGKVVGAYDKVFPTIGEIEDGTLPGKEAKIFQTDFGRVDAVFVLVNSTATGGLGYSGWDDRQ